MEARRRTEKPISPHLADCFGVALAIELDAPFWTSDRHELSALADAKIAQIHFIR